MSSARNRFIVAAVVVSVSILGLIGYATSRGTAYYLTPDEIRSANLSPQDRVRVKGAVVDGSVQVEGPTTTFTIAEAGQEMRVSTNDVLPDIFGDGIEVVAEGSLGSDGVFAASTVLAKCPSKFESKTAASG